jgi:hypothetical protein
MLKDSICSSLTSSPFLYSFSTSVALTFSPVSVVVDLMNPNAFSKLVNGSPAQFLEIKLNNFRSIGLYFEAPGG